MASLRVCEAAMAAAYLIRGRAWQDLDAVRVHPPVWPTYVHGLCKRQHQSPTISFLALRTKPASHSPDMGTPSADGDLQMVVRHSLAQYGYRRVRSWGPLDCLVGCRVIGQPCCTTWGHCMLVVRVDRGQELLVSPIPY